jgi:hypothetical protein
MKSSSGPRKAVNLSDSLHHQLNMYTLAASAAGVSVLALAQPAEAKIVYTPANIQISGKPLPMDLNHDGIVDFFLFHYGFHSSLGGSALLACLYIPPGGSRTICGYSSKGTNALNAFRVVESKGNEWGAAVQPGAEIIGGDRFRSGHSANLGQVTFLTNSHRQPRWSGPWVNGGKGVQNRYVGIKFQIKGRFHFGWARMTVTTTSVAFTAILTGYAYETVPNKGIIAGQTKGKDDSNVEQPDAALTMPTTAPATLGALAMGAPGLSIWRRKEASLDGQ